MVSPVAILFLLKNAPNCTLEHPYFQKFSGGSMPPWGAPLTQQAASRQVGFAHQKNYPQGFSGSAADNELMSGLTEQAVLECDVSGLAITSRYASLC